jgi:hypothetical protein
VDLILLGRIVPIASPGSFDGAVGIAGSRIAAVGSRAEVLARRDRGTLVVDLGERAVLPGFGDSHVHLTLTGMGLLGAQVREAATIDEVLARLADFQAVVPPELPIWAHGFSPSALAERRAPTREELDRVSRDRVVFLVDRGHHGCYVNSAGLRALAELEPSIAGADRDGELVGRANTAAKRAFARLIDPDVRLSAIRAAADHAVATGTTGVHALEGDWSGADDPDLIAAHAAELATRVAVFEQVTDVGRVVAKGARRIGGDIWLDGGLYQRTAAFEEPYTDDPSTRGQLYYSDAEIRAFTLEAHAAGLQIAFHAIGDRAIDQALDAFAAAQAAELGRRGADARHRVEHFTYGRPDQFARAAELGVVLSMQANVPMEWTTDEAMTTRYLGAERAGHKSRFGWALEAGCTLAGGSDADVRPMAPLAAMRLMSEDPRQGRAISVDAALRAYTLGPALATFQESELGTLEAGKLADLVVLSGDPFAWPWDELEVVSTIVGGRIAHGGLPMG